jgi:hypothetical protein
VFRLRHAEFLNAAYIEPDNILIGLTACPVFHDF